MAAILLAASAHAGMSSTAPVEAPAGGPVAPAEVVLPKGDYQVAWLTAEKGWEKGETISIFLGLRGGKATTVWFCGSGPHAGTTRVWVDDISVRLEGGNLKGEIKGRQVGTWAPIATFGEFTYAIDATVGGGQVSGTVKANLRQPVAGTVKGILKTEGQMKKDQGFPAGKDWPSYYGAGASLQGPDCGARMVSDLGQCRPVWRSEETMSCCWGRGPDGRYKDRAFVVGPTGGASSPVVAGGFVYQFYYWPSGPAANESALKQEAESKSKNPVAQTWYVDWHRPLADDRVVCLDAATGKTVWKAVFPGKSVNHQTHKWRGFNPTPAVSDGIVYVVNYSNRCYALDAKTGAPRWEYGAQASKTFTASAAGPVVADGTVVMVGGQSVGLDAKTGNELWKGPGGNAVKWSSRGKDYVIVGKSCLDPKTGKPVWTMDMDGGASYLPLIDGDRLVGIAYGKSEAEGGRVVCYALKPGGAEKLWSVPAPLPMVDSYGLTAAKGHVYVDGEKEMICLSAADGKVVGKAAAGGARTQLAFAADGRVFIQPEGRHGGQSFWMLDGTPGTFKVLGACWTPPHPHDTAYANMPISYPVVDGRLFVRGFDGVYCYDLRVNGK
jgi:outer membrane protein assembly factor BamB